jgi:selenide,water dikinase
MKYLEDKVTFVGDASKYALMFSDAQTSGGLLISMNEKDAIEYVKRVQDLTYGYACVIGSIIPRGDRPIIVY